MEANRTKSQNSIYCTSERTIRLVPRVSRLMLEKSNRRTFEAVDGSKVRADVVVFATGYRQRFPFLPNHPTCAVTNDHVLPPIRGICFPDEPRVAFLGFTRPNVGAIPPMSELQVYWWLRGVVDGRISLRDDSLRRRTYSLLGDCEKAKLYGVDYGLYMETLASDFGASPSILGLLLAGRLRALLAYTDKPAWVMLLFRIGFILGQPLGAVGFFQFGQPCGGFGLLFFRCVELGAEFALLDLDFNSGYGFLFGG